MAAQVRDEEIARRIGFVQNAEGCGLAPFDAWLLLRGLKTMALRMGTAQSNAVELVEVLRKHPAVTKVHYLAPDDARGSGTNAEEARLHYSQVSDSTSLPRRDTSLTRG